MKKKDEKMETCNCQGGWSDDYPYSWGDSASAIAEYGRERYYIHGDNIPREVRKIKEEEGKKIKKLKLDVIIRGKDCELKIQWI